MRVVRYLVAAGAALCLCTSALAFQETEAPVTGSAKSGMSDSTAKKSNDTTVLNVPGLGNLGVIPKLDFGLDLLYGQDSKSTPAEPLPSDDDGLRIRGSIKHRF